MIRNVPVQQWEIVYGQIDDTLPNCKVFCVKSEINSYVEDGACIFLASLRERERERERREGDTFNIGLISRLVEPDRLRAVYVTELVLECNPILHSTSLI